MIVKEASSCRTLRRLDLFTVCLAQLDTRRTRYAKCSYCLSHLDHLKLENREPTSKDAITGLEYTLQGNFHPNKAVF